jgi:quercetin dioxygenase-like cupin family protein
MTVSLIHPHSRHFVSKPWGWEDWLYNDEELDLGMKILFVKGGRACSMHRHSIKEEVIYCESGQLVVEYLTKTPHSEMEFITALRSHVLLPGLGVHIAPDTWHRLAAIEDAYLYEAGTFHRDTDSERLPGYEKMTQAGVPSIAHPDMDIGGLQ